MKNKVITSQGNVQFIFPDGKIVNVHPNHIYTAFNEDTVSFILVALPKSSGLALMTSKAEDLELNGETYSFAELPAAMSEAFAIAGAQARCEIVDELPETGYTNTIYLVPQPSPQTGFDEYVYVDGEWELIGDTSIEMENYVTKTVFSGYTASTAAELSGKAEVVEITQANYDLLPSSAKTDASKLYVISDAQPIDLSVYAKTSAVTSADTVLDNKIDAVSGATDAALALKQNILTAGTGIDITSDVISVTGSTGGITSGEVQTMIDESISGKADTSSLATVATSGSYDDLTNKPTIPTVPTSNTAFTNDAQYATSGYVDSAVSGKANSSDVYQKDETSGATEISTALAEKLDATAYTPTVVDSALDSGSTNPVEGGTLYDELRIVETSVTSTEITMLQDGSGYHAFNIPSNCYNLEIIGVEGVVEALYINNKEVYYEFRNNSWTILNIDSSLSYAIDENKLYITSDSVIDQITSYESISSDIYGLGYGGTITPLIDKVKENEEVTSAALTDLNDKFGGLKLVKISQSDYDNLQNKDDSTLYVII